MFSCIQVQKLISLRFVGAFFYLVFFVCNVNSQVSVRAELDTNYILIGDKLRMKIELSASSELKFFKALPQESDTTGNLEFLEATDWEDTGANLYQYFTFTCFDSAYYNLLPIKVVYKTEYKTDTAYSNSLGFLVDNPPIDSTMADIKPIIKEPTTLEDFYALFIFVGLLIFSGLLIWFFFFRKKEEKQGDIPVIIRPAHEVALEKLSGLKNEALWQKGEVKNYYSKLTFIFREYLENRFQISALESTSEQIVEQLHERDFDSDMESGVRRVLQSADLVKFAKARPPEEFHEESFEKLEKVILKTKKEDIEEETESEADDLANEGEL